MVYHFRPRRISDLLTGKVRKVNNRFYEECVSVADDLEAVSLPDRRKEGLIKCVDLLCSAS